MDDNTGEIKKQQVPFTQVANEVLYDKRISLRAKGLFAYMYSKPDGWEFAAVRISNETTDGRDGILAAMAELLEFGYMKRIKLASGRIRYSIQHFAKKPKQEFPIVGKTHSGKSRSISNTEEESNTDKKPATPSVAALVIDMFKVVNPNHDTLFGNTTQRKAAEYLHRKFGLEKLEELIGRMSQLMRLPGAPQITTPDQLVKKMGQMIAFARQQSNRGAASSKFTF